MKNIRQGITPRQAFRTLMVAIVAMLLVPVGAEAAKEKLVQIVDPQTGAVAGVTQDGGLRIGNDPADPLAVDGSVMVQGTAEPLDVTGTVEIDRGSAPLPVTSVPGLPGLPVQAFLSGNSQETSHWPTPYVALTSISVSNVTDDVVTVTLEAYYTAQGGCEGSSWPRFSLRMDPHEKSHLEFPVPLIFNRVTIGCSTDEPPYVEDRPVIERGYRVTQINEEGNPQVGDVLLLGYRG